MIDDQSGADAACADGELSTALLRAMSEAVYVVDRSRTITYWNPAAERLTGFTAAEVIGHHCRDGILNHVDEHGVSLCRTRCPLVDTMRDGKPSQTSMYLHHRDGHRVPVSISAAALRDRDGSVVGAVEVFHDDTRYRTIAGRLDVLQSEALTDSLTGLGNRRLLQRELQRHQAEYDRTGQLCAVLFIDIDHFKDLNDSHGHEIGDQVLQLVAATLRHCIRPYDTAGRWGGDEFLVLARVADQQQALAIAERVRNLVATGWLDTAGDRIDVTVSIGVAVTVESEPGAKLVDRADAAMFTAKTLGRNRSVLG